MPQYQEPTLEELNALRCLGFRPQIIGCLLYHKEILFAYSNEHELWQIPQGGIENGEHPEEAFTRELTEEIGATVMNGIIGRPHLIMTDRIEFPPDAQGTKELFTDEGRQMLMKGKFYFAYAAETQTPTVPIHETEFNETRWCDYAKASELTASIYQRGKRRVTQGVVEELFKRGLIE